MNSYFQTEAERFDIIGAVSLSTGDGLEMSERFGYDASRKPQALTYRKRNTALTATIQSAFTPNECINNGLMLFEYISSIEYMCGQKADLFWNGKHKGSFIITSVDVSATVDTFSILSQISISISLTEGYIRREPLQTAVSTL